jgi:hypothetical protein
LFGFVPFELLRLVVFGLLRRGVVVFWALWVLGGSVVCLFAPSLCKWLAALLFWFVDLLSLNQTRICFFFFCCFFLVLKPLSVPAHLAVFSLHREIETEGQSCLIFFCVRTKDGGRVFS